MVRWAAVVLVVTGCAQLAGLDETSKPDALPPGTVRLTIERVSIGTAVTRAPQDLSAHTASYLIPDVSAPDGLLKIPATVDIPGSWSAPIENQTPPVLFDLPDLPIGQLRILDLPNANLRIPLTVFEDATNEPAPPNATIAVNVSLPTAQAGQTYQIFTVGAWSNVSLPAPIAGAGTLVAPAYMYAAAGSPSGRYDKLTTDDVVLILRFAGNQLVGHLNATPFDQTGADTITGAMTATTLNHQLTAQIDQAQVAARLSTVRPAVGTPTMTWSLRAAPGADYGIDFGPLLNAANVLATDPATITATYGNPVESLWRTVLLWNTRATRSVPIPGTMLAVTLTAGLFQRALPTDNIELTLPAGLPDRITANGTVLLTDDVVVVAPETAPVEVTFVTDVASNTLYATELFELVPNAAVPPTAYVQKKVITVITTEPRAVIPREYFVAGSYYDLRAVTFQGGFPNVADGDLATRTLPIAQGFVDSGIFRVTP